MLAAGGGGHKILQGGAASPSYATAYKLRYTITSAVQSYCFGKKKIFQLKLILALISAPHKMFG